MSRPLIIILAMASMMSLSAGQKVQAQEQCPDTALIYLGSPTIQPCSLQNRINIPVYINNPCPIGGFLIQIYCSDPSWATFDSTDLSSADTIGSRISGWESFHYSLSPGSHSRIQVIGIANLPGGGNPYLPIGNGLIFTIHPHLKSYLVCDTNQALTWGTVTLSDTIGYSNPPYWLQLGEINVAPGPCGNNPRGDANCSGVFNGIDVIYLVNFLKGHGPSFCCLCSGDANHSGSVNGIDITFMINYLKGYGPPPDPCD